MKRIVVALLGLVFALACPPPRAHLPSADQHWIGAWEAAPQLVEPRNMPPSPGLSGVTLRQVIHPSIGGATWRFRLSNEFGDGPLVIDAAHVARSSSHDVIESSSDVTFRFDGRASVTIAPGGSVLSDPVSFSADAFSDVAVTLSIARAPSGLTGHPGSRTTSFIASGNRVADGSLPAATPVEHWYVISGADVMSAARGAIVVLGNSIADGRGSGTDKNNRWPDNLARRFAGGAAPSLTVLNAGIGGNAVVRGGLGPTALARFDRDVLAQVGVRWMILSEGVNDIGGARGADSSASIARQLIDAYREMIRRAHARQIRVFGATILPFGGSQYSSPEHEAARGTVNAWIRDSGAFDGVIDFDAAMRDPADPTRLRSEADSGDHLHPNELGYRLMADAVDLSLFAWRP
jgi:lysophospholipase L1-like esterase